MSTKRKGDSCYEKAGLDEPIFVLRAQDVFAPTLVRLWARMARMGGLPVEKVVEAYKLANDMEDWPTRKMPD